MSDLSPWILPAIVIAIWVMLAALYGRKMSTHQANAEFDTRRPPGHVTIVRNIEPTNYSRKFKVLLNGERVALIEPGQTIHLKLSNGSYRIQTKIDFCVTEPLTVEVSESRNAELTCGSTYNDWKCMFMWAVHPRNYLYLRQAA